MPYLWLIKILAVLALLGGTWWAGDRHGHRVELAAQAEAREAAREDIAITNKAQAFKAQEADHAQELKRVALSRALDSARTELQRLRDTTTGAGDLPGSAADPGLAAYAADGDRIINECAQRYLEVDAAKASLAGRLGDLQRLLPAADPPVSAAASPDQPASENAP